MWLVILWLIGLSKLLYHFFFSIFLLIAFVYYKIFRPTGQQQFSGQQQQQQHKLQEHLERQRQLLKTSSSELRDKIKFVILKGARAMRSSRGQQEQSCLLSDDIAGIAAIDGIDGIAGDGNRRQVDLHTNNQHHPHHNRHHHQNSDLPHHHHNKEFGRVYLGSLAVVVCVLFVAGCHWPSGAYGLEQDAEILKPVANMAKAVIKTVTLGVPLDISFDPTGFIKNFAYFTWRTRFPVSMPRGFVQNAQEFYNRVKARVDVAAVSDVERKSLANLKTDLDDIVDGIVSEVRASKDGLYTNYLNAQVNGVPLEDACVAVGTQLKAYGVDLTNYRNIAGMVLGIPVMPTVASAVMNVKSLASMDTMRNLTSALNPASLARLPGSAIGSTIDTIDNLRQQVPLQNMVQAPFSLLSSGQRFLLPQRRPAAAAAATGAAAAAMPPVDVAAA